MRTDDLQNCTFVKTILMIFVILGHSVAFWTNEWFTENPIYESIVLKYLHTWINSFHIYAFTLVSGYIFSYKMLGGGYKEYLPFVKNKAKRLLIPYVFIAFAWVVPLSEYFLHWDMIYIFKRFVCCTSPSQLWFLWMLFDVFVIVRFIWKIISKSLLVGILISLGFYCIGYTGTMFLPNIFCIWTAFQYIPFFYIGMVMWNLGKNANNRIPWFVWIILDALLLFLCSMLEEHSGWLVAINVWIKLLFHAIGAIMAFVILQKIANLINWKKSKIFQKLSEYSMPMYLFHQQIIYFIISWLNGKVNPYINASINFVIAILGSLLISSVMMRWRVTRRLIGELK